MECFERTPWEPATAASDSFFWRSPTAVQLGTGDYADSCTTKDGEPCGPHHGPVSLTAQSQEWPTPNNHDGTGARGPGFEKTDRHYAPHDLVSKVEEWPTPNVPNGGRTSNTTNYRPDGSKQQAQLEAVAGVWPTRDVVSAWPTPTAQDHRDGTIRRKEAQGAHAVSLNHLVEGGPDEAKEWQTPTTCRGGTGDFGENLPTQTAEWQAREVYEKKMWKTPHGFANTDRFGKTAGAGGEMAKQVTQWRTPDAPSERGGPQPMEKRLDGGHAVNLQDQVTSWATPKASDGGTWGGIRDQDNPMATSSLTQQMRIWPTPRAEDSECCGNHPNAQDSLTGVTRNDTWATPAARDMKGGYPGGRMRNGKLSKDTLDVQIQALPSFHQGQETERPGPTSLSDGRGSPQLSMFPLEAEPEEPPPFKENANGEWGTPTAQTGGDGDRPSGHRTLLCNQVKEEWPTPTSSEQNISSAQPETRVRPNGPCLADATREWPTPISGDAHLSSTEDAAQRRLDEGKVTLSRTVESMQNWPTPGFMDGTRAGKQAEEDLEAWEVRNAAHKAKNPNLGELHMPLTTVANSWATPSAFAPDGGSRNCEGSTAHVGVSLADQVLTGSSQTGRKANTKRLNPTFVSWLMGYPLNWARVSMSFGPTEMALWRSKQRQRLLSLLVGSDCE